MSLWNAENLEGGGVEKRMVAALTGDGTQLWTCS